MSITNILKYKYLTCDTDYGHRYSMTSGILVPGDDGFSWVGPHQCIWEAPVSNMRARYTLCEFYDRPPGRESTTSSGHQSLHSFFRDIVAIATWGWETAVEELEHQSEHGADFDHILDLYKWLGNSEFSDEEDEGMRYVTLTFPPIEHLGLPF